MSSDEFLLYPAVEFETSNGGTIEMVGTATNLTEFGVTDDGWAFYDDLYFNPYSEATLNVADRHTKARLVDTSGKVAASFRLVSLVPDGRADIEVRGLLPDQWYRLEFNSVLAETEDAVAHDKSSERGELIFKGVKLPNE
ncbi:hypothetical protein JMJ58_19220 [Haloterrigena salifodinae]|uniref:Uncharacterized protein n=1 Tax=Haloterrigena salifodinae TaxID=2675099 RepID=A0A8T8DZJ6_9EURY|nr:hypothetical protein [Haloterrigena salifodinae]QRV15014.1 hypothetical protein JMJ58_19220 [Haloterrigena salifodinae]